MSIRRRRFATCIRLQCGLQIDFQRLPTFIYNWYFASPTILRQVLGSPFHLYEDSGGWRRNSFANFPQPASSTQLLRSTNVAFDQTSIFGLANNINLIVRHCYVILTVIFNLTNILRMSDTILNKF